MPNSDVREDHVASREDVLTIGPQPLVEGLFYFGLHYREDARMDTLRMGPMDEAIMTMGNGKTLELLA